MALGRLGIPRKDFNRMSPRELYHALKAKREESQDAWVLARWQTWILLLPHVGKQIADSPQKWYPFPWEDKSALLPTKQTPEQMKAFLMSIAKPKDKRKPKRQCQENRTI